MREEGNFPIAWMCRKFGVARSSYYAWKAHGNTLNSYQQRRVDLAPVVIELFKQQRGRAGARTIAGRMNTLGFKVSARLVARIMAENNLVAVQTPAFNLTTVADEATVVDIQDHLQQRFAPDAHQPGMMLVGDITYLKTLAGWLYLATVIDVATRKVLGFSVADHMRTSLVVDAMGMAVGNGVPPGSTFHSDHGSVYTSTVFQTYCQAHGITQSMGRAGTCYDNAVAESFFGSLKTEFYDLESHPGGIRTTHAVAEWITFYNTTRYHSSLGYYTPDEEWDRRTNPEKAKAA